MIALSMLAAVSGNAPRDAAFEAEAKRCGLKPDQVVWLADKRGKRRPAITPHDDPDGLSFEALRCIMRWSEKKRYRVTFISEPPPSD